MKIMNNWPGHCGLKYLIVGIKYSNLYKLLMGDLNFSKTLTATLLKWGKTLDLLWKLYKDKLSWHIEQLISTQQNDPFLTKIGNSIILIKYVACIQAIANLLWIQMSKIQNIFCFVQGTCKNWKHTMFIAVMMS
jgi:hypothetical protein